MSLLECRQASAFPEKHHAGGQEKKEKPAGAARGTKVAQEAREGQPWVQLTCRDRQIVGEMGDKLIVQRRS